MSAVDVLYFAVGIHFLLDGILGYLQTRNWVFFLSLMGAWLIAVTLGRLPEDTSVVQFALAIIGTPSVIVLAAVIRALRQRGAALKPLDEYMAIRRPPRSLIDRFILHRYTAYADLPTKHSRSR